MSTDMHADVAAGHWDLWEHPGLALLQVDPQSVIVAASDGFCALLGRQRDELVGRYIADFTHPGDPVVGSQQLNDAAEGHGRGIVTVEKRYLRGDGTSVWARLVVTPSGDGGAVGHITDISELVLARDRALSAQKRLEALIEHSADMIAVLDANGRLAQGNQAAERVLGWKVSDYLDEDLLALIHPDDLPRVTAALEDTYARPGLHPPITYRVATPDGRWVHLESVGNNQLGDPAIAGIVVNSRDVSEAVAHRQQILTNLDALVAALAAASEVRDPYTAGHQSKVARMSASIATHLGLPKDEVRGIRLAASLHDIGKIAVPAEILTRPGRLSPLEFELVKTHCRVGHDILKGIDFAYPVAEVVLHHHERLDGSGYPDGLAGDDVSLGARIVAVADVLDAMASHRPYRPSLGVDSAYQELVTNKGRLYDPAAVDAAIAIRGSQEP